MFLIALAYLGGALTIVSPCILPVLPLVFSRADKPFVRSGLPLLIGMALTFAIVASLAVAGGAWVSQANQYGRAVALAGFGTFGFALLFPVFAERLMRPLVNAGSRLEKMAKIDHENPSVISSLVMGIATGLLWAPCAGPILGLVLTGAAVHGANGGTTLLLLGYAAGAATSLAIALRIGGRVLSALKRSLGVGERVRRGMGGAILLTVAAMALGLDTRALAYAPAINTAHVEDELVRMLSAGAVSSRHAAGTGAKPAGLNTPAAPSAISNSSYKVDTLRISMRASLPARPGTSQHPAAFAIVVVLKTVNSPWLH